MSDGQVKGWTDEERRLFERGRDQFEVERQAREASMKAQEAGDTIALQAALDNEKWVGEDLQQTRSEMSKESLEVFQKGWGAAEKEHTVKRDQEQERRVEEQQAEWAAEQERGKAPSMREIVATVAAQPKQQEREREYELEI